MVDKPMDFRCLLAKIDGTLLIKILQENSASISLLSSKIAKKLDEKIISLVKIINIAINVSIFKAKFFAKSIPRFDKNCKNA